jgi:CRISPR-associated protein (TIGR03985 family)
MKRETFNYPPTLEVLKLLTPGSLKQNLAKAVRLWVILRSIYGDNSDKVKLELAEEFTFLQWRDLFFLDAKKHHLRDKAPNLHHPECCCAKKVTDWLFLSHLSLEKTQWCQSFQKYYSIQNDELENLLSTGIVSSCSQNNSQDSSQDNISLGAINNQKSNRFSKSLPDGRLFAVTSRNLKDHDFQSLVNLGWLKNKNNNNQDTYLIANKIPDFFLSHFKNVENQSEQFTHEELSAFNNSLSPAINGVQRFFIHTEYIVHPQLYNRVELLQKQLKTIWEQDKTSLVKLNYQSAKLYQETVDCIVYPVCIYYYQRAPYLFAYGQIPQLDEENNWNQVDWYDYRLDRIIKLDGLHPDIDYVNIPRHFVDKCYGKYPPSPDDIKKKMSAAWGFDIYKPQELLVLRFDQYFYGNYILRTERDEMFTKISRQQVENLVKFYTPAASVKEEDLLVTVQSRSPNDIYGKVYYRVNDNNIVMRLRAWGPNVEVILPWDLRQRMKKEMEATYKLYK